jgi:secreted Zn-dependent insulinase-like peptidase
VQSSRVDNDHIASAISDFFAQMPTILADITEEEFDKARQSLTQQLTEKDTSLRSRSQRLWSAITQQDHDFSRLSRIALCIEALSLEQFKLVTQQLFNNTSGQMFLSASPANFDSSR